LLETYFGDAVTIEEEDEVEGLRIPHFYRSFYVYKYATGLAAAIALSKKVLEGGVEERERYLSFLKTGGSLFPLDSLARAGVDLRTPEPLQETIRLFDRLLRSLEEYYS